MVGLVEFIYDGIVILFSWMLLLIIGILIWFYFFQSRYDYYFSDGLLLDVNLKERGNLVD